MQDSVDINYVQKAKKGMSIPHSSNHLPVGNGHHIYWEEYGDPAGAPLLLVHGGSGFVFDMEKFTATHESGRRVIVMHQRGVGGSLPAGEHRHNNVQDNIDDIEALRAHLEIGKWDVFGWSFGAVFAAGYALQYPQRCSALISYAPYFGSAEDYKVLTEKDPQAARGYLALHGTKDGKGIVTSVFNKAASPDRKQRFLSYWQALTLFEDIDKETLRRSKSAEEWDAFFKIRRISAQHDLELHTEKAGFLAALAKTAALLPFPVTLIYGGADTLSAPHDYSARVFPQRREIFIQGAGHDIHAPAVQDSLADIFSGRPRETDLKPASHP